MIGLAVTTTKKIAKWKVDEVAELTEKLKTHKTIIIANIEGFPADKLHEIRKKLRGKADIKVTKNNLFNIALKNAGYDTKLFESYLTGPNAFIFTDTNPFELQLFLSKFKLKRYALPGDKADEEVVVPAGDTGIAAGPMLSVFGKLKIKTKVQDGKIHILQDTTVAKPGDEIPADIVPILQKLGIMPVYVKLNIKIAYDNGVIIPGDKLSINLDDYTNEIRKAHINAFAVATEIAYPEPKVLEFTATKAMRNALALASEIGYITQETAQAVFTKAVMKAYAVASSISGKVDLGVQIQAQPQVSEQAAEKKEEKKEEEKKGPSEEEIGGGLSSLFGG
ncbi:50S ribosomal protein L10 [Sulfolobus acidocaldarius]|uniref:Large ribosomal subunit protein uL10 n=3 Tax=Sulfolobus acidocaldarius TaxID=2285 RepID=RL10_SULAC|nr:50S ribosomal protein L10 [Sulfolobus acidocaldarius]P35023.1 RecName: Full=Large ribosomal subunit protein uL10; AltName: Full=50S ribosomal protein L10; AltName: Full=Acidic ribosomal protein P0 homolog; AltName: Full=L10e [Sulfolobus acidocaldarius DSM 639]CAA41764.1 ribosomal protein L10 [Saccharolobus solfataricus]AAY80778.1 50S ribosomal protein L10P [Sulfolobus acidocaldarius DSM 639]AGE71377.1 acidic ribosomal protein P0 [Sulfolobus acidocaldarius N8]AGE73648.1 acidic ribosomal prot